MAQTLAVKPVSRRHAGSAASVYSEDRPTTGGGTDAEAALKSRAVRKDDWFAGECKCGKGLEFRQPCLCKQYVPNIYNKEVYSALNTRGGAIWERLHKEKMKEADVLPPRSDLRTQAADGRGVRVQNVGHRPP